ncbi:MAG: metallophosphoesterase family protein [Bacillota bacterium]|jgi:putative phosphoesterase
MRLALISDVHGNATALRAVLADMAGERVERIISLGDAVSSGPQPEEVLQLLAENRVELVIGNTEQRLLHPISPEGQSEHVVMLMEIEAWIRQTVPGDVLDRLRNAKQTIDVQLGENLHLLCCHGSPRSANERLVAELSDEELERTFIGSRFDLLAAGHTHIQMLRNYRSRRLLNPGTVGSAIGMGPVAQYALLSASSGRVDVSFRSVPYDITPAVEAAKRFGMPHAEWWVNNWLVKAN